MFSYLLDHFNQDRVNRFTVLLELSAARLSEALPRPVRIAVVKSGSVMGRLVPTLANCDAAAGGIKDVQSVEVPMLRHRIFYNWNEYFSF